MRHLLRVISCMFAAVIVLAPQGAAWAQDFGPYTSDANTVLLMHFDGDFTNASSRSGDGNVVGNPTFGTDSSGVIPGQSALGQQLQVQGDGATVADNDALDLADDWTIESWINADAITGDDRVINKDGGSWFQPNYFFGYWTTNGETQHISGNYSGGYFDIRSDQGDADTGTWYHLTYIRDTSGQEPLYVQFIHRPNSDGSLDLLDVASASRSQDILTSSAPLSIGGGNEVTSQPFDGSLDELRISDVVRDFNFEDAPLIVNLLPSSTVPQTPGEAQVEADVYSYGTAISSVTLHYDDGSGFQTASMTQQSGRTYTAAIPNASPGLVDYYVTARGGNDSLTTVPATGASNPQQIALVNPYQEVLALDFEGGSGAPEDRSDFDLDVQVIGSGSAAYSSDAIEGNQSFKLDGNTALKIDPTPFTVADDVTIDLWVKYASFPDNGTRLLTKEGADSWFTTNYQLVFNADGILKAGGFVPGGNILPGGPDQPADEPESQYITRSIIPNFNISTGEWHHVTYRISNRTATLLISDSNNSLVGFRKATFDAPLLKDNGNLLIAGSNNSANHSFVGKIDDITIRNNAPAKQQTASVTAGETGTVYQDTDVAARVDFSSPSVTDGDLYGTRIGLDPGSAGFQGTATSPSGTVIGDGSDTHVSKTQHWTFETDSLSSYTYEMCLDHTTQPGISDPGEVVLAKRANPSEDWMLLNTTRDGDFLCASGQTSFSDFTFASESQPLPVELVSFEGVADESDVVLTWRTASESANAGFTVQRKEDEKTWRKVGYREGAGTTSEAQSYRLRVAELNAGVHTFRLKQVDRDGAPAYSHEVDVTVGMAERYVLNSAYPNPFSEEATVAFGTREAEPVHVALYDALGRKVRVLYNGTPEAGQMQKVTFDDSGLSAGLYLVRLTGADGQRSSTVVLAR